MVFDGNRIADIDRAQRRCEGYGDGTLRPGIQVVSSARGSTGHRSGQRALLARK